MAESNCFLCWKPTLQHAKYLVGLGYELQYQYGIFLFIKQFMENELAKFSVQI